jgi:nitrogen regulatory protein PII
MIHLVAVIKPFKAQKVIEALQEFELETINVLEVRGWGRQNASKGLYAETEFSDVYLPKIELRILVDAGIVEEVADKICEVAQTGRIGDGKIFLLRTLGEFEF